ncbi:hypothetical protein CA85_49900 [Allorhodopirellula solitaria]|uniref:Uncharacterized protein n=1 Tax=Allorhodopirellula solitaria TaxID=2527987 RepID=A0A5C5WWY8_9BACT|nr:hypothetical protein CA85_49900 [Allorhodopirellula solitaria]
MSRRLDAYSVRGGELATVVAVGRLCSQTASPVWAVGESACYSRRSEPSVDNVARRLRPSELWRECLLLATVGAVG